MLLATLNLIKNMKKKITRIICYLNNLRFDIKITLDVHIFFPLIFSPSYQSIFLRIDNQFQRNEKKKKSFITMISLIRIGGILMIHSGANMIDISGIFGFAARC